MHLKKYYLLVYFVVHCRNTNAILPKGFLLALITFFAQIIYAISTWKKAFENKFLNTLQHPNGFITVRMVLKPRADFRLSLFLRTKLWNAAKKMVEFKAKFRK